MSDFTIEATAVTPQVTFEADARQMSLEGECYPENPMPFFDGITAKLATWYTGAKPSEFVAVFRLQYVNSSSTKGFRALLSMFNDWGKDGTEVQVVWEHEEEDDTMEELGQDLVEDFGYIHLETATF